MEDPFVTGQQIIKFDGKICHLSCKQYSYVIRYFVNGKFVVIERARNNKEKFYALKDKIQVLEKAPGIPVGDTSGWEKYLYSKFGKQNFISEEIGLVNSTVSSTNANRYISHENDQWVEKIIPDVEKAINSLVDQFIRYPYLHRVEHSLHCELFMHLQQFESLNQVVSLGDVKTGLIHKEWPETIPRPEKVNRRGNFDLVILNPPTEDSTHITEMDFQRGLIKPAVVIEAGLNYNLNHLDGDIRKMQNSKVERGYLIHFLRESDVSQCKGVKERVCEFIREERSGGPRIVYVSIGYDKISFRRLGEDDIKTIIP